MNKEKVEILIRELLAAIGENIQREGLHETPKRIAKSFEKLFEGYEKNPEDLVTVFDNEGYDEMIIVKNIDFYSFCEHHMLPFYGKAFVGYIPGSKIIGISKLARLVELYSRRLQNQERLTKQIADTLKTILDPKGVGVVIEAEHMCMKLRGVEKQNCKVSTSSFAGKLIEDMRARNEFLQLIK